MRDALLRRDALGKMEEIVRVIGCFDLLQAWQISAVVSLLPTDQVRIDVVLVGGSAGVWAQRLPGSGQPGEVRSDDRGGCARVPIRRVLGGEQRAAVDEGGCAGGNAIDRAAIGIESDTPIAECGGGLTMADRVHQNINALARQEAGEVVGLRAGGVTL